MSEPLTEEEKRRGLHGVPLSDSALAIIKKLFDSRMGDFVFSSPRGQRPLCHVAMAKVMRRLDVEQATVHGFRSAFRDWAGNETHFPSEVAEVRMSSATKPSRPTGAATPSKSGRRS